jgi:hypothetical protein
LSPATLRVQQANYNRPGYDQDRRRSQEYSLPETQFAGESIRHNALDTFLQLSTGDTGRASYWRRSGQPSPLAAAGRVATHQNP